MKLSSETRWKRYESLLARIDELHHLRVSHDVPMSLIKREERRAIKHLMYFAAQGGEWKEKARTELRKNWGVYVA